MIKALDYEYQKRWIEPTYTGQLAICPVCKKELSAAIYTNQESRFRHSFNEGCAFENKTISDWHVTWQSRFENTEYRYPELGLRADVLFQKGLVLELQHSPIKYQQMRFRENGYQKMVWIFDLTSQKHKKNIQIKNKTITWEYPDKHWICYIKPAFFHVEDDLIIDLTKINFLHEKNLGGYPKTVLKSEFYSYSVSEFISLMYKIDNLSIKDLPISIHRIL
jgi:competence CoiA-like predicted nuclease